MPRTKLSEDAKIVVKLTDNPRRPGSSYHRDFEVWKKASTVGEALKLGATMESIKRDIKKGFIKVTESDGEKANRKVRSEETSTNRQAS